MFTEKVIEATKDIANGFKEGKIIFLTESDLKTALSNQIRNKFEDNITINTESPWYDTYVTNNTYYIDITAFDKDKLQITYDPKLNRKGYKYEDEALAMELKYFRYNADIDEIAKDFYKVSLLINAPKNECFIVAGARTPEIFEQAKIFMESQLNIYRTEYSGKVKIYLFGTDEIIEFE